MKRNIIALLVAISLFLGNGVSAYATEMNEPVGQINKLVIQAEHEMKMFGAAKDVTIARLNAAVKSSGINSNPYGTNYCGTPIKGYGESQRLSQGWTYRVDRPSPNSGDMKPHVHVLKNGREIGIENVDGTSSHGRNLNGVPKDIKDKVRGSKDYKKGQQDLKKMKEAKAEIAEQNLDLSKTKDLVIAAGIFITIVGVLFFAPEALPIVLVGI